MLRIRKVFMVQAPGHKRSNLLLKILGVSQPNGSRLGNRRQREDLVKML